MTNKLNIINSDQKFSDSLKIAYNEFLSDYTACVVKSLSNILEYNHCIVTSKNSATRKRGRGMGVLVGPNLVLTAAHNVICCDYGQTSAECYENGKVIMGNDIKFKSSYLYYDNGISEANSRYVTANWTKIYMLDNFLSHVKYEDFDSSGADIALIVIDKPLGIKFNFFKVTPSTDKFDYKDDSLIGLIPNFCESRSLFLSEFKPKKSIIGSKDPFITHTNHLKDGQSGSPVLIATLNTISVHGINAHSFGSVENSVKVHPHFIALILHEMNEFEQSNIMKQFMREEESEFKTQIKQYADYKFEEIRSMFEKIHLSDPRPVLINVKEQVSKDLSLIRNYKYERELAKLNEEIWWLSGYKVKAPDEEITKESSNATESSSEDLSKQNLIIDDINIFHKKDSSFQSENNLKENDVLAHFGNKLIVKRKLQSHNMIVNIARCKN